MKNDISLKPCPFCGNKNIEVEDTPAGIFFFKCKNKGCGVMLSFTSASVEKRYDITAAAKAWNRRAE